MRYFSIVITEAGTNLPIYQADGKTPFGPYSSTVDGSKNSPNLPGAYNVEWDLPITPFDAPASRGFVKIWGVGIQTITQATALNPTQSLGQNGPYVLPVANIQIYGGMHKGLPLANPMQAGLLLQSQIQQAYGNWQGTEQSLEFIVFGPYSQSNNQVVDTVDGISTMVQTSGLPGNYGSSQSPINLQFNWMQGQTLSDAVTQTLKNAFPGLKIVNNCQSIQLPFQTQNATYDSLFNFSRALLYLSQSIVKGNYQGVRIAATTDGFTLFDGSNIGDPVQIGFNELIGQPAYKNVATINFKTPMRADLQIGQYIKMPPAQYFTTKNSNSAYRNNAAFQGAFMITAIRHLGHSRQISGDSWVTSIDATIPAAINPSA